MFHLRSYRLEKSTCWCAVADMIFRSGSRVEVLAFCMRVGRGVPVRDGRDGDFPESASDAAPVVQHWCMSVNRRLNVPRPRGLRPVGACSRVTRPAGLRRPSGGRKRWLRLGRSWNWPAIASVIAAMAAAASLYFAGWSLEATRTQNEVAEQGQFTDRFTKAVDQLDRAGVDHMQARLGGIHALKRLALDSPRDHAIVVDVLSAFVRTTAPRPIPASMSVAAGTCPAQAVASDVQTALTVLGRLSTTQDRTDRISLRNVCLHQADLTNVRLTHADLTGVDLSGADLTGADLRYATLRGASLTYALMNDTNFTGADLLGADLTKATAFNADLTRAKLAVAELVDADVRGASLEDADLGSAVLSGANFLHTDLDKAYLGGASLKGASLSHASLRDATFFVDDPVGAAWGALPRGADLTDAYLTGADLTHADLSYTTLNGTSLDNANLTGGNLAGADLTGADLTGAELVGVGHDEHTVVADVLVDEYTRGQWW